MVMNRQTADTEPSGAVGVADGRWSSSQPAGENSPSKALISSGLETARCVFDEKYLAALKARDPEVEKHLIAQFSTAVRVKLRARLRSPELIEDAYQETFLRVFAHFQAGKTLNSPASLPGFIHGMCHNVSLELLRGYTRHDQMPDYWQGPTDGSEGPQDQLVTEERKEMVRRLLGELAPRDSSLLKRIFLDEEDKDAVCRDMNIDRDYLRIVVFRARKRFRSVLERAEARSAAARR